MPIGWTMVFVGAMLAVALSLIQLHLLHFTRPAKSQTMALNRPPMNPILSNYIGEESERNALICPIIYFTGHPEQLLRQQLVGMKSTLKYDFKKCGNQTQKLINSMPDNQLSFCHSLCLDPGKIQLLLPL